MDEIFAKYRVVGEVKDQIRGMVESKGGKKDKEFFRGLIDLQRRFALEGQFFVELLETIVKVKKGKPVPKKSSGMKVDKVVRNADGSVTVTLTLPAELFDAAVPEKKEPVPPKKAKVDPQPATSVVDQLKPKYMAAISGVNVDAKSFWEQVLYHSLDKGIVSLASIAAKTGKTKEHVRTHLQNRYNSDVVSIVFSDGEDSVNVTWASTTT